MHFCIPIARCSRPSLMDRANENTITSHKSNLSILRPKENWFGSVCRIWNGRSSIRKHGRNSFARYFRPLFATASSIFALPIHSRSRLYFSSADIIDSHFAWFSPRWFAASVFSPGSFAPRKRAVLLPRRRAEHGKGRRTMRPHRSLLDSWYTVPSLALVGSAAAARIGIYDFRIGRDCRLLRKSLSWGNR